MKHPPFVPRLSFVSGLTSALLVLATTSGQAQQVFTKPSGFVTITADAAASASAPTFTFVSHSLARKRKAVLTASAATTSTVTAPGVAWDGTEYVGDNGPHYVLVETGDLSGVTFDITAMTSDTLTLDVGDRDATVLNGQDLTVYQHNTLGTVFGTEDPTADGFVSGDAATDSSQVMLYDFETQGFKIYYYNTVDSGSVLETESIGWISPTSPEEDATDTILDPNRGFIILNRSTDEYSVRVFGDVIDSEVTVPIIADGYNLINVPYPVENGLTLGTSGLYDADNFDPAVHLKPGSSRNEADLAVIWEGDGYGTYYVNSGAGSPFEPFFQGWIKESAPRVDASSTPIPTGSFFILRRGEEDSIDWTFPSVLD